MTSTRIPPDTKHVVDLSGLVPEEEWRVQRRGVEAVRGTGVPFALGGGLAISALSGRWRNTKDVDLFLRPADRDEAIAAVRSAGFDDYFDVEPYDRGWIFRAHRDGLILDLIWQMANYRAEVDEDWVTRGPPVALWGDRLRLVPPEELLWSKLYVMQRTRCDWPDLLNLLHARGGTLEWERLIDRVGPDGPLLAALVTTYGWLSPADARQLPQWLWGRLGVAAPNGRGTSHRRRRIDLLDSRDWYGPTPEGSAAGGWDEER